MLSTRAYAEIDTASAKAIPLIASLKFDNNLKDDANQEDLIAYGNHSFVDGILPGSKALHLEKGSSNYVSTSQSLNFDEESFTVSFWYKGDTNNNQVILSNKDFGNGANAGWAIYTSANSINMNLGFPNAKEKKISFGRDTFDASDWRHVTFVVDRVKMLASLYIDGYEMAETTLKLGSLDTSNPLNIGSDGLGNFGGNEFDIAELVIWKEALSLDAIKSNYSSYAVNNVDMIGLNDAILEANAILAGGIGNGYSETDFDYLKKVGMTANTIMTTQKEKLYTQETINYYERELNNAIFIYQKSNKTVTPADLNMIVNSDTEISSNPAAIARVEEDFRKSMEIFSQADVMLIPGDVTGGNNAIEYLWMNELTNVYNKLQEEGLFNNISLYLVRGNHDMGGAEKLIPIGSAGAWNESTQSYDNNFFNDAYRVKINGYNLVVFDGNYDNNNTSGKAKNFLNQITQEEDYDPTKPIFVSSHFPISGTNWGSAWSTAGSNNVGKYIADNNLSQVVYVSGHTHFDPTDERSLYQGAASYFDAGSTNYSSYIDGGPYGGYIEGSYIEYKTTPRISNFLEVYGTKVIIKHYNLSTEEFVGIPSVVYVGEGKEAFTYSKSDIRELIAPQFDEDLKIKSLKSNEVIFTMKQANDNVRVLEYNVQLINKLTGEVEKTFNSLSLPLDKPFDEHREYKFTGLSPQTPYTIRVFAADSMYNRSSQDLDITTSAINLIGITEPAPVSAPIGIAKIAADLGLPQEVKLDTNDGSWDTEVNWDVDISSYDPALKAPQTFTVTGIVTLPAGMYNPSNVPLTTSISVSVKPFIEDFENGFAGWIAEKGTASTSSTQAHSGTKSYVKDENVDVISKTFSNNYTGLVSAWYYDNLSGTTKQMVDVQGGKWTALGVDTTKTDSSGSTKYQIRLDGTYTSSGVDRTKGWHKFTWDYTSGEHVDLYIDDQKVATAASKTFNRIAMGDFWGADGIGYFDDITIENLGLAVKGVVLSKSSMELEVGETETIAATVEPDAAANKNITWKSNNEAIVSVDQNGVVTANAEGTATITVTTVDGGYTANCIVTVKNPMPKAALTGPQIVNHGQTFDVTMGLTGVTQNTHSSVYAQDMTLHYDPTILQFDSIISLRDGFQVNGQKEIVPGQIRIIASSEGTNVSAQGDWLAFKFTAKSTTQTSANTTVSIENVLIANELGNELQVSGASYEVTVSEDGGQVGTIPAVPTGLQATAASTSQINVTWNDSVDATSYDLMVDGAIHTDVAKPFSHTGLAANTSHTYKVRAKNLAGASEWSTQVNVSTQSEAATTPTPEPKPDPKPNPKPDPKPEPTDNVFNSNFINVANLINAIKSKVEEAKKSNDEIDLADLKGHWAEKTLSKFVKLQEIVGFEDGTFRPNSPITRAEFASIIARVFDINGGSVGDEDELSDINSHWARNAINNLASAGIINGYGDGTFKPNQTISREEVIIILSRMMNLNEVAKDDSKGNFTDMSSVSAFAVNQIKDAAQAGIISGRPNGVFDPKGTSTRAEALTIILNALNLNPQIKILLDSLN